MWSGHRHDVHRAWHTNPLTLRTFPIAAVLLTACASSTEPTDTALTGTAARSAASVYVGITVRINEQFSPQVTNPSTRACPSGGSLAIVVVPAPLPTLRFGTLLTNCAAPDGSGQVWTFTTLPRLDVAETTVSTDSTRTTFSTITGSLRVESASVRGSCRVDVVQQTVNRSTQTTSVTARITGQVCGQTVDTVFTAPR